MDHIRRRDGPAEVSHKLARLVREIDPDLPDPNLPRAAQPADANDQEEPENPPEPLGHNSTNRTGELVERWIPGGGNTMANLRARLHRHRLAAVVLLLLVAIGTTVTVVSQRPEAEPAPALPAAISASEQAGPATTETQDARIVVSVVGRVIHPGLVTLTNGARVLDAVTAAGGVPPDTDLTALNLARKLADGEQIYVGIPAPPGAAADPPAAATPAPTGGGKGKKGAAQGQINLNSATADQLQTLPGVGPTTAQKIITWRTQHGPFTSVGQLREVGGIGQAKFAKLENLVTV